MDCVLVRRESRHLEIQVGHIVTVEMLDSKQDLLDEEGGLLLSQSLPLGDEVEEFSSPQPGNEVITGGPGQEILTVL